LDLRIVYETHTHTMEIGARLTEVSKWTRESDPKYRMFKIIHTQC